MRINLPPPDSWEEFEAFSLHLWKSIWADHNAQMHGRRGQPQAGVDIYGRPFGLAHWEGVQCKGKDGLTRAKVSKGELRREVQAARQFAPKLGAFVLATTAPRDVVIQSEALAISNHGTDTFRVSVWSWDDIEDELNFRDYLIPELYPQFRNAAGFPCGQGVIGNRVYLYRAQPLERAFSFLTHPEVQSLYPANLRIDIRNLIFELALNAFEHGGANRIALSIGEDGRLEVADDGAQFDPLNPPTIDDAGAGMLFVRFFADKYRELFILEHSRTAEKLNVFSVMPIERSELARSISAEISLLDIDAWVPSKAEYLARTAVIPDGYEVVELHISAVMFSPSSLHRFLRVLLERIPTAIKIRIFCGSADIIARCLTEWMGDSMHRVPEFVGRIEVAIDGSD